MLAIGKEQAMKKLVKCEEVEGQGLLALLGERVAVWCVNYIYSGVLSGVNTHDIELTDACVVYETGPLQGKFKDAQDLPKGPWYIRTACIESYGPLK